MATQMAVVARAADEEIGSALALTPAQAELLQVLEVAVGDVNTSGAFLDAELLRRLMGSAQAALREVRHTGPCGRGCPRLGLHCPVGEGPLADVLDRLDADGFGAALDVAPKGQASVTCVCGRRMVPVARRRGTDIRAWATCPSCYHWVGFGGER